MASTYSSNLKIELIATGEQSGIWGNTTNDNFTNVFEQAIVGRGTANFPADADLTLTFTDSVSSQTARNVYLNATSGVSLTQTRNLIVPTINKNYVVQNNTTGSQSIVVKTSAGTGITIPNGFSCAVYVDGTNVIQASNYFPVVTATQVNITGQGDLRLEDTTGGEYVALQAPGTLASSYTLTLPVDDGTNGQALITDGNGNLSWSTAASGDVYGPASATDNAIARFDLTTGKLIQNSSALVDDAGNVLAGAGLVGAPAFSTTGDTNTGIYFPAADTIAFTEGGVEAMRITSGGEVGINATSPAVSKTPQLFVRGNSNTSDDYIATFEANNATAGIGISYQRISSYDNANTAPLILDTNGSERMRITSTGDVGIGTSSPLGKLSVSSGSFGGTISNIANQIIAESSGSAGITIATGATSLGSIFFADSGDQSDGYFQYDQNGRSMRFGVAGAERMRLDASGNLGLGVTPSAWNNVQTVLQIKNSSLIDQSGIPILGTNYFYNGTNNLYITSAAASRYYQSSGSHVWQTAASGTAGNAITFTQAMTLDASGNLLVGTTSASGISNKYIDINDATDNCAINLKVADVSQGSIYVDDSNNEFRLTASGASNVNSMNFFTGGSERMRITSGGDVGIGITSPGVKLDVLGTIRSLPAATQDAVAIAGRAGGTSSYVATITPTTLTASRTITLPDATTTMVGTDATQTLTNKFIQPRVSSTASITSPLAWNSDNFDQYSATAQAGALTINADAGNPVDGEKQVFCFTCDATPRVITFTGGASKAFKPVGVTLTTSGSNFTYTLTASKTTYFGAIYNAASARWEIIALSQEA